MAKQLNVNLAFKADTTQAKQQLQQLQTQLNNLTTSSISQQLPITPKLQEAQNAAINLKIALQQSMNVDTGKFDLTKFNNSLKRAGTSLNQMRVDLSKFGPEGQQAFMTLAQSIMQAEVPMRRTNALLTQLGTTLKNTAKWQISSMALHGFMSAVSGAYGYAYDLNESLNNIRIVTGKNIEDMKNFANQANKAAKALSTTTTAYTDASLIYYQQGLSDAEVLKRADVTVKMANATGQAAEVVSDQMTAIWNNFYDGSKALEYYSDVVTALGAATASSSDEIAEGLEKFAAVADTVGLSYEYATSALATVTATTRQSADVVGTAFKTLFARIQDLELGKTLDDGTTLGAYAESLQAVGINIKASNGELKKMDDILNEMGSVWKTLGNDQQAALAQSVAGVRQYTQLMALMENWDYFKDNLEVAKDATGTLQEQADIYAESWEAAQKRVQASAQAIYQDLISDEFFIDLQNNFADFLDTIDKAIDSMGGLKGVVALLGGVLLTAFSGQAARGLENMAYNIKMMTTWGSQEIMQTKELAYQEAMRVSNSGYITATQEAQTKVMQNQLRLQNDLVEKANKISDEEKERCQAIINENKLYGEQLIELTKIKEEISDAKSQEVQNVKLKTIQNQKQALTPEQNKAFGQSQELVQIGLKAQEEINRINNLINTNKFDSSQSGLDAYKIKIKELIQELSALGKANVDVEFLQNSLENLVRKRSPEVFKNLIHEMATDTVASTNGMASAIQFLSEALGLQELEVQKLVELMYQLGEANNKVKTSQDLFTDSVTRAKDAIANAKAAMTTWADSLVHIAGGVSSLLFAIQSLSSIGEVFKNEDLTAGEKFLQITMSLAMALPMVVNGIKALRLVKLKELATTTVSTAIKIANAAATEAQARAEERAAKNTDKHDKERKEQIVTESVDTVLDNTKNGKKPNKFTNFWNQQSLQNNKNFMKQEDGSYLFKNGKTTQTLNADEAASAAGKQSATQLGKMAGGVALIAAAIAVVAGTITWASAQWNKAANEAKKTAEEASKLSNEFSNAQNQYSELKDTISNYQEGVKGLQELTKGTTEYTEAMMAANEEASKLIDQYGLTNYTIEDGLIKISEAELNAAKAAQLSEVSAKQRAAADANIRAKEAENEANRVKFNRNVNADAVSGWDVANTGATTAAGAGAGFLAGVGGALLAGTTAGSAAGPIGAIIGAAVGLTAGIVTAVASGVEQKKEQEAIEGLAKLYENDKNIFATDESLRQALKEDLNIQDEDLIEELVKNRESTKELVSSIDENNKLIQAQRATAMASYLQGDKTYQNSEYQDQIANILSKENENSAYTKALKEAEDKAWKGTDKNIHKAYAEYMGYEFVKDTNSGTGKFKDAQGNEIELDDETMVEFLTNEYARQEAAKNVEEVSALLDSLTNVSGLSDDDMTTAQTAIADFIAGDSNKLLALSDEQMAAVKEQLKNGIKLTDEEAQMLGYDNAAAFTKAFDKQLENWSSMSSKQRAEKIAAIKQQEFDSAIASTAQSLGVSSEALEGYTKALQSANPELKDNSEAAIAAAKANINFSKGVAKLDEALKDNYDILHDWNEESFETYEAAGKVQAAVKEMFGVDVSANFVRDNLQELQELTEGNTKHLDELREAAAKDFVVNLGLEEGATNALDSALDTLINQDREGIKIGAEVDLGSSVDQLNQFLKDGTLTAEQVTQAFNAIGYEPEIGYITDEGGQTVHQSHEVKLGGTDITLAKLDSYTTSDVSVPYIKSSTNKDSKGKSNKSSATKTTSTGSIAANLAGSKTVQDKQDKKEDRLKSLKNEKDRYHEINEIISDTERELDQLGKAKDRAFGANKLALMDKEIAKQKELIENNKQLLKEAEKYYQQDRNKLLSSWDVQLDSIGRISNYEEIQQRYIDRLKANAGNEKLYEDIEEEYEDFKNAAEKYEESLNKVEEQAEKVNDELDALYEKNLEKIEYKVQIKIDIADDDKAYLDFLMQKVEDDAFAAAEAIGYLGEEASLTLDKIKANEEGIADVERALAAGEITPEQAVERMREYRDELVDLNADLLEIRQTVQDKLTEAFEGWNEEIEIGITKLEHYGSVLENYKNIIDIVGKDMLGISDETMSNLSKVQIANANNVIRATKAQLDANNSTLEKMRQARAEAEARGDEESAKEWDEQIKVAEEKSQELTTTLQEALSNGLQLAADDFALTVEQIADSFSKAVSGIYDDIENMRDGWGRMQEVADRYLETYEKTYEINKLNRKIQDSIDKTDSVASQKELRDLQNEMYEITKDGQQLSKYDLEYLQKKYDLLVAEQALKDAQNAKSVVRLQRDSEGNFGYVYTADQGTVDNAEQNYEDKLYAFQEYTHKMDEELTEMYISVQEQAYERMQAAAEMYGEGTEAFERERQKILEQYNIDMGYITDEYEKLTNRNLDINQRFNAGVADTYKKTFINSIVPQYQSFEQLYDETTTQCEASCTRLDEAITLLQQTFDKQLELAGQDLEGFEKIANEELEKVQGDSSTTADEVEDMADRMNIALNGSGGAIDAVEEFQVAYSGQMEKIRTVTEATIKKVKELIVEYGKMNQAASDNQNRPGNGSYSGTNVTAIGDVPSAKGNSDLTSSSVYKVQDIALGTKETRYKINNKWYTLDDLNAPKQGHTEVGDEVTFTKNEGKGASSAYQTFSLSGASLTVDDSEDIRRYDINGKGGTLFYGAIGKDNLSDLQKLSIIGYKYDTENKTNLYKLSSGFNWGSANKTTYWLNQTDLHQLLNQVGKTALYKRINLQKLDTGGYTGSWGPEGRLAMLHQKELVLNAHDTENFLAAIGIVRDISDQIEKNAIVMQYQNQLANYRASVSNSGETLQQEVHITAEFPNATDHNEIEEAFKNLTNLASQYANRKS